MHSRDERLVANRSRKTAFTLVEMLVSLAVLTVALSIVGAVFGLTTRAAGQSAAYAEVQGYLRQFAAQFEADLRGIDPARSVLTLTGRTQAVALTQDDLDARRFYRITLRSPDTGLAFDPEYGEGDPYAYSDGVYTNPRADLIMFFTNRAVPSIAAPALPNNNDTFSNAAAAGAALGPVQVMYGHAAIGKAVWTGSQWTYPPDNELLHIQSTIAGPTAFNPLLQSALPGTRWHLARRQVIIEPTSNANQLTFGLVQDVNAMRRIRRADPADDAGNPCPGDSAELNFGELLRQFSPARDPAVTSAYAATLIPYGFSASTGGGIGIGPQPQFPSWDSYGAATLRGYVERLLVPNDPLSRSTFHFATLIENPPADLRSNSGMQLVPGCVEFRVEFLMPEDSRNSDRFVGNLALSPDEIYNPRPSEVPNWATVGPGQTYCFAPDSPENRALIIDQARNGIDSQERFAGYSRLDQDSNKHLTPIQTGAAATPVPALVNDAIRQRVIRLWPYALRVTVRVIDARGRLDEPIARTFVHRFPE